MPTEGGRLILVGAPLGNVGDASTRLRDTLSTADVVAAEDTRRLARLARDLGIVVVGRVVSYFEGNEERRTPELAQALRDGRSSRSSPTAACPASPIRASGSYARPSTRACR